MLPLLVSDVEAVAPELHVPRHVDEVDASFITSVFRSRGLIDANCTCTQVRICAQESSAGGYFSNIYFVGLEWDITTVAAGDYTPPSSICLKLPPFGSGPRVEKMFEREACGYALLEAHSVLPHPRPYLLVSDASAHRHMLLLEDMRPLQPPGMCSSLDVAVMRRVVASMARFHAQFWGHSERPGRLGLPEHLGFPFGSLVRKGHKVGARIPASMRAVRELFPDLGFWARHVEGVFRPRPLGALEDIAARTTGGRALVDGATAGVARGAAAVVPKTLIHGDCHLSNIFVRQARGGEACAGDVLFFDFQGLMSGHPAVDVAFAIVMGMDPRERSVHEGDLVREYCTSLRACGVGEDLLSGEACWEAYRFFVYYPLFTLGNVSPTLLEMQSSNEGMDLAGALRGVRNAYERVAAAMEDHQWLQRFGQLPGGQQCRTEGLRKWCHQGPGLPDFPGVHPLEGERLLPVDVAGEEAAQVWNRLSAEARASLAQPRPDWNVGFEGWVGRRQSPLLQDGDYRGRAAVYRLFTAAEARELARLAGTGEGKYIPSKEQTAKTYMGRFNTLQQAVKDRWLTGALWQRLSEHPGGLVEMQHWDRVVGANSELRLARTQPPRAEGERAGQHLKHIDTREDNKDFVSSARPEQATRISVITVQCYLNPEEHEGGEFVLWPARLNLATPENRKETILYEPDSESSGELVSVKIPMKNGQCVVFHQDSDQLYHGGAPVFGSVDKVALRFVLDMEKKHVPEDLSKFYDEPPYGMGFTNDRTSIETMRTSDQTSNPINCAERKRAS